MQQNMMRLLGIIAVVAVVICIVVALLATVGAVKITDGCFYRYNFDENKNLSRSDSVTNTIRLRADANYVSVHTQVGDQNQVKIERDPNHYGEWMNTNFATTPGQVIKFKVKGDVSLCRGYIPENNLQSISNLDKNHKPISIPRIEEGEDPVSLIFDAKTDEWRNIAEVFAGDQISVFISPDQTSGNAVQSAAKDIFNDRVIQADCREGKTSYSPICGRFSIYGGQYVNGCYKVKQCIKTNCRKDCRTYGTHLPLVWLGDFCGGEVVETCDWLECWKEKYATAPEGYKFDGTYTTPWSDKMDELIRDFSPKCKQKKDYIEGEYKNKRYFWFSANNAAGLLYRFDSSLKPSATKSRGSKYSFAKILDNESANVDDSKYKMILDTTYKGNKIEYLQYRFHDTDGAFADNTGGYILSIKQTKCKRSSGVGADDTISNRGSIYYIIVPGSEDPNESKNKYKPSLLPVNSKGEGSLTLPSGSENSYIWMKINNAPEDYKDSFGQYLVEISTSIPAGQFTVQILNPLFKNLKEKVRSIAETIFKNMICYNGGGDKFFSCINFFNYIKAMLILYVMSYGAMFLLGMVQISQKDIVIRVIKIAIVSGLMSERTFDWFNFYVFDFITGFSDQIIANMGGYSMFSASQSISNPFMFLDSLMSKILFSKAFLGQLLALISMGISGMLYFIIVLVALIILIITLLRSITVYIMAFLSVAILIGLAPLFLTFMLFETTWYLFDNWVRFTFRYMIEPVVLMAGIIIMTQLFTIYLDFVIGYSVCWKCALPLHLPFPNIPNFTPAFVNVDLFCLNWFAPWGLDHRTGMMGINMQHMVALVIIAYCMYGYRDLSSKMVIKITKTVGPSATETGKTMSNAMEQSALGQVGLDDNTRRQIRGAEKERSKNRDMAIKAQDQRVKRQGADEKK